MESRACPVLAEALSEVEGEVEGDLQFPWRGRAREASYQGTASAVPQAPAGHKEGIMQRGQI